MKQNNVFILHFEILAMDIVAFDVFEKKKKFLMTTDFWKSALIHVQVFLSLISKVAVHKWVC